MNELTIPQQQQLQQQLQQITNLFKIIINNVVIKRKIFKCIKWIHLACKMDHLHNYNHQQQRHRNTMNEMGWRQKKSLPVRERNQLYTYFINAITGRELEREVSLFKFIRYDRCDLFLEHVCKLPMEKVFGNDTTPSIQNIDGVRWHEKNIERCVRRETHVLWDTTIALGCNPRILRYLALHSKFDQRQISDQFPDLLKSNFYYRYKVDRHAKDDQTLSSNKLNMAMLLEFIEFIFILHEKYNILFRYSHKFTRLIFHHPTIRNSIIGHINRLYRKVEKRAGGSGNEEIESTLLETSTHDQLIIKTLTLLEEHKVCAINWKHIILKSIRYSNRVLIDHFVSKKGNSIITASHLNYAIWMSNNIMIDYLLSIINTNNSSSIPIGNSYTLHSSLHPKVLGRRYDDQTVPLQQQMNPLDTKPLLEIIDLVLNNNNIHNINLRSNKKDKWILQSIHPKLQSKTLLETLLQSDKVTLQNSNYRSISTNKILGSIILSKDIDLIEYLTRHISLYNHNTFNNNNTNPDDNNNRFKLDKTNSKIVGDDIRKRNQLIYMDFNHAFNKCLQIGSMKILELIVDLHNGLPPGHFHPQNHMPYRINFIPRQDADDGQVAHYMELIKYLSDCNFATAMGGGVVSLKIGIAELRSFLSHTNPRVWEIVDYLDGGNTHGAQIIKFRVEDSRHRNRTHFDKMLAAATTCSLDIYKKIISADQSTNQYPTMHKSLVQSVKLLDMECVEYILPKAIQKYRNHPLTYFHMIIQNIINLFDELNRLECLYSNSIVVPNHNHNRSSSSGVGGGGSGSILDNGDNWTNTYSEEIQLLREKRQKAKEMITYLFTIKELTPMTLFYLYYPPTLTMEMEMKEMDNNDAVTIIKMIDHYIKRLNLKSRVYYSKYREYYKEYLDIFRLVVANDANNFIGLFKGSYVCRSQYEITFYMDLLYYYGAFSILDKVRSEFQGDNQILSKILPTANTIPKIGGKFGLIQQPQFK